MSTVDDLAPVVVHDSGQESRRERLRLVLRSRTFLAGAVIVVFWILCALFGPALVPDDPYADDILNKLQPPSSEHWFGTDRLGRDGKWRNLARQPIAGVLPPEALDGFLASKPPLAAVLHMGAVSDTTVTDGDLERRRSEPALDALPGVRRSRHPPAQLRVDDVILPPGRSGVGRTGALDHRLPMG